MRVIGGEFRSRVLKSLPGRAIRPTPDILRETLFNVLATRLQGVVFVDAYAGTGSVGIEALSRGASRAIFIEHSRAGVEVIRANLEALGLEKRANVIRGSAGSTLARYPAEIVFLDPPYDSPDEYNRALEALGENPPSLVIAQHESRTLPAEHCGRLRRYRVIKQGSNALSFYEPAV